MLFGCRRTVAGKMSMYKAEFKEAKTGPALRPVRKGFISVSCSEFHSS
jgi:hypothetical protein